MHYWLLITSMLLVLPAQAQQRTYCNPINIDYGYTPFEQFSQQGRHRTTADPVIVNFKGNLFSLFDKSGGVLV